MPDYSKGKIYKIECNITGEVYYGSTTQHYLSNRIGGHKNDKHCISRLIIERGNYNYKVLEYCPCDNKIELETRERWWIKNNVCINKVMPHRTQKEYYEDNKDKILEQAKQYRESNKDKRNEYIKQYHINNKEIIKSKQNEKIVCNCGGNYTRRNKARHIKSKQHQDFIISHTDTP